MRRIILRLLSNTKWILKSFIALSFEFLAYVTLYAHSISLSSFFSWRALPFEISFLHLPYCFYLCSPILLFFLTIAHRTTILCLSTCVHLVFVWLAFWSTNILYYLPTFFISRYLIWSHLLSKNLYIAESKTNDLVNDNGVSLAENVNWYKKVWKKLGSCKLGIKFLLVAWLKKTICCSSHIQFIVRIYS